MIALNILIDKITKTKDISCNNLSIFFLQCLGYKSDIKIYKECVLDNEYVFEEENTTIENLYFRAKKIKNKFVKLVRHWKWKKSIKYSIDTDLYLNKLDNFKDKYKIVLMENNTRYQFRLSDLINYWIESLNNSQGLFSKPLMLKNPHTNLDFSIHNLYNIYFKLLDSGFTIPIIITNYFFCDMDVHKFSYDYYHLLKENTIDNFIESNFIYEQWEQLLNMLHDFRKNIDYITFTNHTPYRTKIAVLKSLKNIIHQYLKFKYSCNPLLAKDSKDKTKEMLLEYLEHNPDFGYSRDNEIMRYVPYEERRRRRRTNPPPPPPIFVEPTTITTPPSTEAPAPPTIEITPQQTTPPPQPPAPQIINPFLPHNELPRTPNNSTLQGRRQVMSSSMSIFRR
mgnify:CR=1 FL=1